MERIDLAVAESKPENTGYALERVTLNLLARVVIVDLLGENGEHRSLQYDDQTSPTGETKLAEWNTSDHSKDSMTKQILLGTMADLGLDGSVSGTPE